MAIPRRIHGKAPVIVDANILAADPEGVLHELCKRVGIAFTPAMLSWEPGPRPEDGCWASFWYADGVHKSSGFKVGGVVRE